MLPRTSTCIKNYDNETKWMYCLIDDDELFEKYNNIENKVSNSTKKELYCESIYNKTFLKTKIKSYCEGSTDFHDKEMPKAGSSYRQVFLKECKYIEKKSD